MVEQFVKEPVLILWLEGATFHWVAVMMITATNAALHFAHTTTAALFKDGRQLRWPVKDQIRQLRW